MLFDLCIVKILLSISIIVVLVVAFKVFIAAQVIQRDIVVVIIIVVNDPFFGEDVWLFLSFLYTGALCSCTFLNRFLWRFHGDDFYKINIKVNLIRVTANKALRFAFCYPKNN